MSMFFASDAHKQHFTGAIQKLERINRDGKIDAEYGAALYILTADAPTWEKAQDYIDDDGIDLAAMLREIHLSSGYSVLVKLAGNLFNGEQHIDPLEFMRLDENNFTVALTPITMRRNSPQFSKV